MIKSTDEYLRLQLSGYAGRSYTVYLEPLIGPSLTNSRNYGNDYYFIVSPSAANLKMNEIRHTYLHFILDPMAYKRGTDMNRIRPLLLSIQNAPVGDDFKTRPHAAGDGIADPGDRSTHHAGGKRPGEQARGSGERNPRAKGWC